MTIKLMVQHDVYGPVDRFEESSGPMQVNIHCIVLHMIIGLGLHCREATAVCMLNNSTYTLKVILC